MFDAVAKMTRMNKTPTVIIIPNSQRSSTGWLLVLSTSGGRICQEKS